MGIRKVKLEDVIPPKVVEVKTYSEAVYVGDEDLVPVVKTLPVVDGQLVHDRLKTLTKGQPIYFPEYRLMMVGTGINTPYRHPARQDKVRYESALRNRAKAMGLGVSIRWVKTKNNTVTMKVSLK